MPIRSRDSYREPKTWNRQPLPVDSPVGFSTVSVCYGKPTGTPVTVPGQAPIVLDATNKELYVWAVDRWISMSQDFLIEVEKGNIPGHSLVKKFGRNPAVANAAWEGILQVAASFPWLTAATAVRVKAGGDSADAAGKNGARSVVVEGLDTDGYTASATLVTDGATASAASSQTFRRVFRAYVSEVGVYTNANSADVVIENSAGTQDLIQIEAEEGQSQFCSYSIPKGKTGYLLQVDTTVDSALGADIRVFTRENLDDTSAPMSPKRLKLFFDNVQGDLSHGHGVPLLTLSELTDIWVEAYGAGAETQVSAELHILLVDD